MSEKKSLYRGLDNVAVVGRSAAATNLLLVNLKGVAVLHLKL